MKRRRFTALDIIDMEIVFTDAGNVEDTVM
jgi:hypothetical protein